MLNTLNILNMLNMLEVQYEEEVYGRNREQAGTEPGVPKTGIRGIQDTRQIVDGKTNDIENNNKKGGS